MGDELTKKFYHILCYYHSNNQKVTASNLWANGMEIFRRAFIVQNFEEYKRIPFGANQMQPLEAILPYVFESIVDKTRIIICFENFMKGTLMLNGIVVHEINETYSDLKRKQKKSPVKASELFNRQSFVELKSRDKKLLETVNKTLTFSTLLKSSYQEVISLPPEIVTSLNFLNTERNRLHFINENTFEHGEAIISIYQTLINFVDEVILPAFQRLDTNIKSLKNSQENR